MSLLLKLYKSNHEIVEHVSPFGTGMGGNLLLDEILSNALKHKHLSESEQKEYERIQVQNFIHEGYRDYKFFVHKK